MRMKTYSLFKSSFTGNGSASANKIWTETFSMSNINMTVISKSKYFEYTGDGIPAETTPLFSFFLSAHVKYKGHHDDS